MRRQHKILCVAGPTAAKKSHVALRLASALGIEAEIVSTDAFQAYRELNAGVNKPDADDLKKIPHHFVSCVSISEEWNVSRFCALARPLLDALFSAGKLPIICGGSHLYADALTRGYAFGGVGVRDERPFANMSTEEVFSKLNSVDPAAAEKIGRGNKKRLIRALQVCEFAMSKKSELDKNDKDVFDVIRVVCSSNNRDELYGRINERTKKMLQNGWKTEVEQLLEKFPNFLEMTAAKATGYAFVAAAVIKGGEPDFDAIATQTRQLAKRQLTWCRSRYNGLNDVWFDPMHDDFSELKKRVQNFLFGAKNAKSA